LVLKKLTLSSALQGTPAYWQNNLFVAATGDSLKSFPLTNGTLASASSSQSTAAFNAFGASPVVSSNNTGGGTVWALDTSGAPSAPAVLHAYDATDLTRELYNSAARAQDAAGPAVKLAVPTVGNGKVYVGTQNELSVYGLLP